MFFFQDCDNFCTGSLLNEILNIANYLKYSNVSDLDPTPMLTLERYRKRNTFFTQKIADTFSTRDRLRDMKSDADLMIIPQSDLAILETEKISKGAEDLSARAENMGKDGAGIRGEVRYIGEEVKGI